MNKVSIIIVTYNSARYLPDFMESVFEQSYFKDGEYKPDVFVIDNASDDGTVKFIQDHYPTVKTLRNMKNIGLCKAWNQGLKMSKGEYVLIMNPDLVMDRDFLVNAVETMDSDLQIASVGGKLYRLKTEQDGEMTLLEKTNILDSCGMKAFKNRRFIDRGVGEIDKGKYEKKEEVFGISGALIMYRRSAMEEIRFNEEFFDEDFFLYQEDIDMAWRLRLAGFKAVYNPRAIAYHSRRAKSQSKKIKNFEVIKHRRQKEEFVNYYSYRNHLMMIYKNSVSGDFWSSWPYIGWYEFKKFIYLLFFENKTLRKSIKDIWKKRKKIRQKKDLNLRLKKVENEEIRKWFK